MGVSSFEVHGVKGGYALKPLSFSSQEIVDLILSGIKNFRKRMIGILCSGVPGRAALFLLTSLPIRIN